MKCPNIEYTKPSTLSDALSLLSHYGERAQILAGGQSLLPMMNLRLANAQILVDITALDELQGITLERSGEGDSQVLRVGALSTHALLAKSPLIKRYAPLLAQAVPYVAHLAIRNKGTIGGSLALADPAAEYPCVALAMNATLIIQGASSQRRVRAQEFFQSLYKTAIETGEILVGVELELPRAGQREHFCELSRRSGDYALIGLAASVQVVDAKIHSPRIAFFGVEDKPVLASRVMSALEGRLMREFENTNARADTAQSAGVQLPLDMRLQQALQEDLSPWADLQASSATKAHLAKVILGRTLSQLGQQHE